MDADRKRTRGTKGSCSRIDSDISGDELETMLADLKQDLTSELTAVVVSAVAKSRTALKNIMDKRIERVADDLRSTNDRVTEAERRIAVASAAQDAAATE
jgi:hypothetical protein